MYFDIPPEVKELGVSQIQLTTQYLIVHNGEVHVKSLYFKNDLQKTLTELKDKMVTSGQFGDGRTVNKIILLISNVWVDWEEHTIQPGFNSALFICSEFHSVFFLRERCYTI